MKTRVKIICVSVIMLLCPVLAFSMKVSFYLGKPTVTRDNKSTMLKMGDIIRNGDIIKTGRNETVEIAYDDNSRISIQQNTIIQIGSKNVQGASDLTVIAGEITGKFGKLKKGVHRINTPTTVCSVRGTEFKVSVSNGGDSLVNLEEGALDVDNVYGEVKLKQGQSIEADMGDDPDISDEFVDTNDWQDKKADDLSGNIDERAEKYDSHFKKFGENSDKASSEMQELSDLTKNSSSKEELEDSGKKIAETEEDIEHDILMTEASKLSVENLMKEYEGTEGYSELEEAAKKGSKVLELQKKNYEAIQNVKKQYQEARERILKNYKGQKDKILKSVEDYRKNMNSND